ncbi:MAG: hypothetical protein C0617_05150 [Desulfuromonas sp.]|uniref:hypothetical protein n=1 Tax=Desulfuromonas sp. TaxID=892 RepID=UPI000CAF9FBC|nr:hypothetical protein [Desulfuromonas sp.]PLX85080.1 MAG: hypothetical protein C0617_05150 [Desulfuromonas sp.]
MKKHTLLVAVIFCASLLILSCTSYKSQEVSFRLPAAYPNMQAAAGAQIGAQPYADKAAAKEAFGFDIRSAGLLPVQVVMDNAGPHSLTVVPEQTFLIDNQGNLWNLLDSRTAYQRVEGSSEYARIAKGAGKGSLLGAAGGAVVGAAIGILTGENVGTSTAKGAAVGGAGGAVIGGSQEGSSEEAGRQISRDLANKSLVNQAVQPGSLGRGFLFFPGEAPTASALRLQLREVDTGRIHTVNLSLF